MVKIQLIDINDNVPTFATRDVSVSLKEGRVSTTDPIVAVSATDSDSGRFGTVTYRIVNGNDNEVFRIERGTGEVFVTKPALVQANTRFDLEVTATDGGGLAAPMSANIHVSVTTAGVGSVFDKPRYNFRTREDVRLGSVIGSLKTTVSERGEFLTLLTACTFRRCLRNNWPIPLSAIPNPSIIGRKSALLYILYSQV